MQMQGMNDGPIMENGVIVLGVEEHDQDVGLGVVDVPIGVETDVVASGNASLTPMALSLGPPQPRVTVPSTSSSSNPQIAQGRQLRMQRPQTQVQPPQQQDPQSRQTQQIQRKPPPSLVTMDQQQSQHVAMALRMHQQLQQQIQQQMQQPLQQQILSLDMGPQPPQTLMQVAVGGGEVPRRSPPSIYQQMQLAAMSQQPPVVTRGPPPLAPPPPQHNHSQVRPKPSQHAQQPQQQQQQQRQLQARAGPGQEDTVGLGLGEGVLGEGDMGPEGPLTDEGSVPDDVQLGLDGSTMPRIDGCKRCYAACNLTNDQKTLLGSLLVAWKKQGHRTTEFMSLLEEASYHVDRRSLLRWAQSVEERGSAISMAKKTGRTPRLNPDETEMLIGFVRQRKKRREQVSLTSVTDFVHDKFDKKISQQTASLILKKKTP